MKILHLSDYLTGYHRIWGGAEQACARTIDLLTAGGVENIVGATPPLRPVKETYAFRTVPAWEVFGNRKLLWRIGWLKENLFPFDVISFVRVFWLILRERPDALHLHRVNYISFSPVIAARLLRVPVVFSVYDYMAFCPRLSLVRKDDIPCTPIPGVPCATCATSAPRWMLALRRKGYDFFLTKIQRFHVLSGSSRDLLASYGIPVDKIRVIRLPLPHVVPVKGSDIQADRNLIVFAGWIDPRKGAAMVVQAFQRIAGERPALKLIIAGGVTDPVYFSDLQKYINDHGLTNRITFQGKLPAEEIMVILRRAGIVVIAEQWHNMSPIVLTETMALGKTVIAGAIGGIPEFIQDGVNGLLAVYNQPDSYADKIEWALDHPEDTARFEINARETISALTDDSSFIADFREMYNGMG